MVWSCFLCFVYAFGVLKLVISLVFLETLLSPASQVLVRDKYHSRESYLTNMLSCLQYPCCELARMLKVQHYWCLALVYGQRKLKLILKNHERQTQNRTQQETQQTNKNTKTQQQKHKIEYTVFRAPETETSSKPST